MAGCARWVLGIKKVGTIKGVGHTVCCGGYIHSLRSKSHWRLLQIDIISQLNSRYDGSCTFFSLWVLIQTHYFFFVAISDVIYAFAKIYYRTKARFQIKGLQNPKQTCRSHILFLFGEKEPGIFLWSCPPVSLSVVICLEGFPDINLHRLIILQ